MDAREEQNIENCTIQEVSAFRSNGNGNRAFPKDDVIDIMVKGVSRQIVKWEPKVLMILFLISKLL